MKKVLVIHPRLDPISGANLIAAYVLEALQEQCKVSLLCLEGSDLEGINHFLGTQFDAGLVRAIVRDFTVS